MLSGIEKMRVKIACLSQDSKDKAVAYAKNLSKLSVLSKSPFVLKLRIM